MPGLQNTLDRLGVPPLPRFTARGKRLTMIFGIFAIAYIGFLAYQNAAARKYLQALQLENPAGYLDVIRKEDGFESYIAAYSALHGFDSFKSDIPPFLVGRWTLKDAPERVALGFVFADCLNPMVLLNGQISLTIDGETAQHAVEYRIAGHDAYLRTEEDELIRLGIVSYSAGIDHLEIVPPGRSDKYYAYLCGN